MFKKLNNKKGYTLVELIISIFIIAIISSIVLANHRQGGASEELNAAAQNLVSEIRKVQSYALGYKEFNGAIPNNGGWGIRLTNIAVHLPDEFILFFDEDDSNKSSFAEFYTDGKIGKNVEVENIVFGGVPRSYFWAIYYPPDPDIILNGADHPTNPSMPSPDFDEIEVVLRHISGKSKSIILNKYGLVDVND